jgi:hypothetical protein
VEKTVVLKRGDTLMLRQGAGSTVEVRGADVWVTQHDEERDYVMRFEKTPIRSDGCALIYAFSDASLTLDAPASAVVQVQRCGAVPEHLIGGALVSKPPRFARRWLAFG